MINNLMRHIADVYRVKMKQGTAQEIDGYQLLYSSIPCFIQPNTSAEAFYYEERGTENQITIYTSRTDLTFQRNDILERNGKQYHVVGVQSGLESAVYIQLFCLEYPENAKKRLSIEAYV